VSRSLQKLNAIALGLVIALGGIAAIGGNPAFILGPKSLGAIAVGLLIIFAIPDRKG